VGEDPQLLAALRAGDLAAFERVVREHGGSLLVVARRLLRNEDEAREALQDAMVSAFRSHAQFEGTSRVSTWLHRIVINSCLMRLRRRKAKAEVSMEEWLPAFQPDGHHEATFTDWSPAADAMIEQEELRAHVRRSIDRLPDTYRSVLLLRDIEGLAIEDVASALGITANAVKIRLHRARQALRTLLDPSFLRGTPS
jgi:RNA polymerase sigma-70 factor (ECF subfamily)